MMRIAVILLGMMVLANPVFAKNHKKLDIACVPSPNPDVPPCDLDQTPLMPSDIAKKAKEEAEKSGEGAAQSTKPKPSRQRIKKTGY